MNAKIQWIELPSYLKDTPITRWAVARAGGCHGPRIDLPPIKILEIESPITGKIELIPIFKYEVWKSGLPPCNRGMSTCYELDCLGNQCCMGHVMSIRNDYDWRDDEHEDP